MNRSISVLSVAAIALCALAPTASASTASIQSGNRVNVVGSGGERNLIVVSYDAAAGFWVLSDAVGVNAGAGCLQLDPETVTCPGAGIGEVRIASSGGDDSIFLDPLGWPAAVEGDLEGGSGDDRVTGAGAADSLSGSSGRDVLDGGPGSDELRGGGGEDVVYYGGRAERVIVTVGAGGGNDGSATDRTGDSLDTVHGDVEGLIGGVGPDILVGDSSAETLFGGEGDDALVGGRGRDLANGAGGGDFISGEDGGDILRGGFGADRIVGGAEADRLIGGPDGDLLRGDGGSDVHKGKGGIDVIKARDGLRDRRINCGAGPDGREFAVRDRRLDPRAKSC